MTGGANAPVERVITLDAQARPVGAADKLAAHRQPGIAHLAFSVLLLDQAGRLLLQRRAASKYHFAGYWSNSCCGHPRPNETVTAAAARRTREELGVQVGGLQVKGAFWYEAVDSGSGLVEREYDIVLVGQLGDDPRPDAGEIQDVRWFPRDRFERGRRPPVGPLTPWFGQVLEVAFLRQDSRVAAGVSL